MKNSAMQKDATAPKLINLAIPAALMSKINDWRRRQPDLPNTSAAIRQLLEQSLERPKRGGRVNE